MKILIIDSHVLVRDGMSLLLQRMDRGFTTLVADTYDEALPILNDNPDIGLVLVDVDPYEDRGAHTIASVRACVPCVPVVVLSARDDAQTIADVMHQGVMGFIPKTHSAELMVGAIELVIVRKGVYLPPSVLPKRASAVVPASEDAMHKKPKSPYGITPKQAEVLSLLLEGKSNKAIARSLGVEPGTIKIHVSALFRALRVASRTEAIVRAQELSFQLSA